MTQKYEIEEKIQGRLESSTGHKVMYYPKFHY